MRKNFARRELKEFNKFRSMFQRFLCTWILGMYLKIRYKVEIQGANIFSKDAKFIAVSNHISNWDPFIVCHALKKTSVAFMAKQELFEKFLSRMIMDWCGAFAVNREKVEVSTLKTALSIKNTKWNLGIFPQGTRQKFGQLDTVNKGFATLAKATKTNILPVAIIGSDTEAKWPIPFMSKNKIIVKIGDMIPYSDDIDEMMQQWVNAITLLTETEHVKVS